MINSADVHIRPARPALPKFAEFIVELTNSNRRRSRYTTNKNHFYGYFKGCQFVIQTYLALNDPTKKFVVEMIDAERAKQAAAREVEKDAGIKKRMTGCIQAFNDILEEIAKGELLK